MPLTLASPAAVMPPGTTGCSTNVTFSFARDDTKVRVSVAARADVLRSWACSKEHEPDTLPGCLRYTSSPSIPTNTAYARDLTCHDLNGCAALSGRQCMNATRSLLQHTGGSLGGLLNGRIGQQLHARTIPDEEGTALGSAALTDLVYVEGTVRPHSQNHPNPGALVVLIRTPQRTTHFFQLACQCVTE